MTITRSCKKMMAAVMAIALVLSVLFIPSPKTAKAGEGDPSVTVLGATIRLGTNDNNGTQSMRIGIKVDNANKAKACAIQLTVGATTFTVATSADKGDLVQDKLHSKDAENNSIVYAVVLTNIPQDSFYANIGILGKAWNMNDEVFTSAEVNKNVMGVVSTLQSKFPELHIRMDNGVLYKNNSTTEALTADDFSGNYTNDPDPETTSNPVVTPTPAPAENTYVVDFNNPSVVTMPNVVSLEGYSAVFNATGAGSDLVIDLPAAEVLKRYQTITINYAISSGTFGFKYHKQGAAADTFVFDPSTHQFDSAATSRTISISSGNNPVDQLVLFDWNSAGKMVVNSVVFSNPKPDYSGVVDLSTATVNGAAIGSSGSTSLNNGVITVNETSGDSTELIFNLPNGGTVDADEQIAVLVSGSCTLPDFNGFRVRPAGASGDGAGDWAAPYQPGTSREFAEVFTLTATQTAYKLALKSRTYNSGPIAGLTITGIEVFWIGRDAATPTAMPSPTPVPTATPVPTPTPLALAAYDTEAANALSYTEAVVWKVTTPIVADGAIDEVWDSIPYYSYRNNNTGDTRSMAKIAWDSNNLYVLVRVKDPGFDSTNENNWNRDGGELFLDENNSKETTYDDNTDAFQYRLTGFDSESTITNQITAGSSTARSAYAGIVAVPKFTTDGYVMEYKIPWSDPTTVDIGKRIGFELSTFDCSGGSRAQEITFITTGGSLYSNPSLFGALSLASETGAAPTPVPTAVPTAPPASLDLTKVTFDNSNMGSVSGGVVYVNDESSDTTFVKFPFNTPVKSNEHITVVVEGWAESSNASFRMYIADGWTSGSNIVVNSLSAGYFRSVLEFTANDREDNTWPELRIRGGNGVQTHITGLEIDAVNVYYTDRGAVVPEAGPTPSPRPTATPGAATPTPKALDINKSGTGLSYDASTGLTITNVEYVDFDLGFTVSNGNKVKVFITGTSDSTGFRYWLGSGGSTQSNQRNYTTQGDFSIEAELTATANTSRFELKGIRYGTNIANVTIKSISVIDLSQ